MSKTCTNCGNIFDDDSSICPRCGTQYIAIQPPKPEPTEQNNAYYQAQPYGQPYEQQYGRPYQQPYGQPYQQPYSQPYQQPAAPAEQPMSVGSWIGTILLTSLFGIISIVLLFVWAFGSDVPIAKKNYCRAMLILTAVGIVLSVIIMAVLFAAFASSGAWEEILEEIERYSYSLY